ACLLSATDRPGEDHTKGIASLRGVCSALRTFSTAVSKVKFGRGGRCLLLGRSFSKSRGASRGTSAKLDLHLGRPRLWKVERNFAHCLPALHLLCPFAWHPGTGGAPELLINPSDPMGNQGLHFRRQRLMRPDMLKIDVSPGLP